MLNKQNETHLKINTAVMAVILFGTFLPANHLTTAHAQSSQSIAPAPPAHRPDLNMPNRAIDRTGTAFSGRRSSVSIKSTDAGIVPRYPQTSACINCGTVDFVNVIGQGNNIDLITGGIINGVIRNKVFQYGQNQGYPIDPHMHGNAHQGHHQGNGTTHYDVGVTMDDGTKTIITQPNTPHFHSGDRIKLIDGEFVPQPR